MISLLDTAIFPHSLVGLQLDYISVITALTLLLYRMSSYDVRRAWQKYGRGRIVAADDNIELNRIHRIQMNTLEHMVFFLPSLWLCAVYFSADIAFCLGVLWLIGRTWYAIGYLARPDKKPVGFHIAMVAALALFLFGSAGICKSIERGPVASNAPYMYSGMPRGFHGKMPYGTHIPPAKTEEPK